jgi:hypothetical protein
MFVLSVPLRMSRWSRLDELSAHVRRYEPDDLLRLGRTGFRAEGIQVRYEHLGRLRIKLQSSLAERLPRVGRRCPPTGRIPPPDGMAAAVHHDDVARRIDADPRRSHRHHGPGRWQVADRSLPGPLRARGVRFDRDDKTTRRSP